MNKAISIIAMIILTMGTLIAGADDSPGKGDKKSGKGAKGQDEEYEGSRNKNKSGKKGKF